MLRFRSIPTQNSDLQLKLARSRNQSMRDIDQGLKEKSDKWTKEKKAMMDEKKELQAELDKVRIYNIYSVDSVCIILYMM